MTYQTIKTSGGETLVVLSLADFEALRDAADVAEAEATRAAIARGEQELLTSEEVKASLEAPSQLAFWRGKRGITQAALAARIGVSQSYVADLEGGKSKGTPGVFRRLAEALRVRMEDIVED